MILYLRVLLDVLLHKKIWNVLSDIWVSTIVKSLYCLLDGGTVQIHLWIPVSGCIYFAAFSTLDSILHQEKDFLVFYWVSYIQISKYFLYICSKFQTVSVGLNGSGKLIFESKPLSFDNIEAGVSWKVVIAFSNMDTYNLILFLRYG